MTNQPELKNCPFCGRKAEVFVHNGTINPLRKGMFVVECYDHDEDSCGCKTEWFEKECDAIEYWNTRIKESK